jgi:hypothetical protein
MTTSGSGGGNYLITFNFSQEDGGPGYTQDFLADLIRDTIDGLPGITTGTLNKHVETITSVT